MLDLFTIGDIKLDTFIVIPDASVTCELKMPACKLCIDYGKKNPVGQIDVQIAGSAPNVAVGIARMNKKTAVYSQMGRDMIAQLAKDFLEKQHVSTQYVKLVDGYESGFAAVLNFKGESTQLVKQNDSEYRLPARMPRAAWLHLSEQGSAYARLYKDVMALKKVRGDALHISINPGVVQIKERSKELLSLLRVTDVLFVNRVEALQLLEQVEDMDIRGIAAGLVKLGPKYVVVTDGKAGAYAYDGVQLDFAPMFPGKRVEATGAGDAFSTGFLGALMHERAHPEALMWGSVNAASVVGFVGPTVGLLSHGEILKRLKERPRYKTKEL